MLFHCFLDLSYTVLYHLKLALFLGGFLFVIFCDLYMGHKMSVSLITVVSLLYIRKNLSSHFIF